MSFRFIIGGSGYGKSEFMYKDVIKKAKDNPQRNYFILVPEQYTMQIQRKIIMMHPDKVISNIDVVSFGRLVYRVFDELGVRLPVILDDIGKSMILRKISGEISSQLKVFQGNIRKEGFIGEVKSTISELMQYHIKPEQLKDAVASITNRPALTGKLHDIHLIYQAFINYLQAKYMTTEELLDHLKDVVTDSKLLRDSEIYFDEFTGFSPAQYPLIGELMKCCKQLHFALTVDCEMDYNKTGENYGLFYLTRDTISRINHLALNLKIEKDEDILLREPKRFLLNSGIGNIEKNLYRQGKNKVQKNQASHEEKQNQKLDDVTLIIHQNPTDELNFVIQEMLKLCHEGYRYKDMAVITGDMSVYSHQAMQMMQRANIPCFIDESKDVLANKLTEGIRGLLDMIRQDMTYDTVFRFLKSGITNIEMSDLYRLENYILATGIRGYHMWHEPFKRKYRSIQEGELEYVNEVRKQVMAWIEPFYEQVHGSSQSVFVYAKALLDFLSAHQLEEAMEQMADDFEKDGALALAREYRQIYGVFENILLRMSEILADEMLDIKEFNDVLEAGLAQAKVGIIPPGFEQVVIGDLRRTRLSDIKVLFFIGINEGIVPGTIKDGGIITDHDKEILLDNQLEMAPTGKQDSYTERFYIYTMLTKAPKIYLSLCKQDRQGRGIRPSILIDRIQNILPELTVIDTQSQAYTKELTTHLYGEDQIRKYMIRGFENFKNGTADKFWLDLYNWFKSNNQKQPGDFSKIEQAAFFHHENEKLHSQTIDALYGNVLNHSVTTLEKYASCAYAHFLAYGLKLAERPQYKIQAPDLGILFHSVLEMFSKRLLESTYNWHTLPNHLRDELVDVCVKDVVNEERHAVFKDNFRNQFLIRRLERMVKRTVWALQYQIQKGDFEPEDYELRFDTNSKSGALKIELSEDKIMHIRGAIDRLDKYETDTDIYVKIIDYKSGSRQFDVAALYYGLQLQLIVYMESAMQLKSKQAGGKNVIPAGILYYNIDDPMVNVDADLAKQIKEDVEKQIIKALRTNGLVNDKMSVIRMMDRNFNGVSDVIPVELTKRGELSRKSSVISESMFKNVFQFTKDKVTRFGQEIVDGHIEVNPYKKSGGATGCDYCPYQSVCGFEEELEGYDYRKLGKLSKDDAWECIRREVMERHGSDVDEGTTESH